MSRYDNNTEAICPCGRFIHPQVIFNPPGLDAIAYRVGDYTTFRHALLQSRADERELSRSDSTQIVNQVWRPSAKGDLALQMMEWWAYLADVLTFYNERVATQAYLRTAELPESVNRLIRLLGYRSRPGIGAVGVLAALANGPNAFTLPKGFQIQSKPGPGQQPQVFELESDTKVGTLVTGPPTAPKGDMEADATPNPELLKLTPDSSTKIGVFLQGATSAVKKGDRILIITKDPLPQGQKFDFQPATVAAVIYEKDARNQPITQIQFTELASKIDNVTNYRLLTSNQSAHVYQYTKAPAKPIEASEVHLEGITRQIKVGDPILFEDPASSSPSPELVNVTAYQEVVFYANNASDPSNPPPAPNPAIPIPHTQVNFGIEVNLGSQKRIGPFRVEGNRRFGPCSGCVGRQLLERRRGRYADNASAFRWDIIIS
jgi:hypothetical protein